MNIKTDIKLVAIDMDGTLLNDDLEVDDKTTEKNSKATTKKGYT